MHIADGILSGPVVIGGMIGSAGVAWYCLKRVGSRVDPHAAVPRAALLTAAFFVASLIQIPLPPAGAHLILNGLLGIMLGLLAFPAILVGLFFQAVMFGHGGITSLGVNGLVLGLPALLAWQVFRLGLGPGSEPATPGRAGMVGALAGAAGMLGSLLLFSLALRLGLPADFLAANGRQALLVLLAAHLPLLALESAAAGLLVYFLQRVRPRILLPAPA